MKTYYKVYLAYESVSYVEAESEEEALDLAEFDWESADRMDEHCEAIIVPTERQESAEKESAK